MGIDQRDLAGTRPVPAGLMRMLAMADRDGRARVCAVLAERTRGGMVSRPCTGGTGDVSTTVVRPAIHDNSEIGWLVCERQVA